MRPIKNKRHRDPRYFLHESGMQRAYEKKARAFGAPPSIEDYGTLLLAVQGEYVKLVQRRDLPPKWDSAIKEGIMPILEAEEAKADTMDINSVLDSAARNVPEGRGVSQLMASPLAIEALGPGDQAGGGFAPDYDDDDL